MTQTPASGPFGLVTTPPMSVFLTGTVAVCARACDQARHPAMAPATKRAAALKKRLRFAAMTRSLMSHPYANTARPDVGRQVRGLRLGKSLANSAPLGNGCVK